MAPDRPAISATKNENEIHMIAISFCLDVNLKRPMATRKMLARMDADLSEPELEAMIAVEV